MYKVLNYFTDLQDKHHPYNEGDIFPRAGLEVSEARLEELSTTKNRRGIKLIELVEEEQEEEKDEKEEEIPNLTKTKINRMSVEELKELAIANEIENANDMTGTELKETLINHFGL